MILVSPWNVVQSALRASALVLGAAWLAPASTAGAVAAPCEELEQVMAPAVSRAHGTVAVHCDDGRARLEGVVASEGERMVLLETARQVRELTEIRDELVVEEGGSALGPPAAPVLEPPVAPPTDSAQNSP